MIPFAIVELDAHKHILEDNHHEIFSGFDRVPFNEARIDTNKVLAIKKKLPNMGWKRNATQTHRAALSE